MSQAPSAVTEMMLMDEGGERSFLKKIASYVALFMMLLLLVNFTQAPLLAIILLGWLYSWMRVRALRHWGRQLAEQDQSPSRDSFRRQLRQYSVFKNDSYFPNIFMPTYAERERLSACLGLNKWACYVMQVFKRLGYYFIQGVQAILNLSVLLLPAGVFWAFSWWGGWNNSFFKGYESYSVGPSLGLSGIAIFCCAMYYVPMAQARHAVTGNWRSFWDFKLVRRIIAERPLALLLLAGLYVVVQLPLIVMKTLPFQFSEMLADYDAMTQSDIYAFSQGYFFWCGVYAFLALLLLKNIAMRIYCGGVLRLLHKQQLSADDLSRYEQDALSCLGLERLSRMQEARWKRVLRWPLRKACVAGLFLCWFAFAAQIYVAQFLKYDGEGFGKGWVNQTLLQLPWFNYTPGHLQGQAVDPSDAFLGR